jgi:hypothetical protein
MRIPLSISVDYVPDWGIAEGLRELMSNYLDQAEANPLPPVDSARFAEMAGGGTTVQGGVSYSRSDGGTTVFENPNSDIQREALLLGVSGKRESDTARGQFGEGLKLGVLALLRCGKGVRIETPTEIWTARLEEHDAFPGQRVLVFHTRRRPTEGTGVRVEVSGIEREDYERMRESFLTFNPPKLSASDNYYGTVIFDPNRKGQVFVKGVLVETDDKLAYGYDLRIAKVDRDRKMVDRWDAKFAMASILAVARKTSPKVDVLEMLEAGAPEMVESTYITAIQEAAKEGFTTKYGADAYPCASMAEAQELEHSGVKAIPVPKMLLDALNRAGLDANKAKEANLKSPSRVWALQDLTVPERATLQWAMRMAGMACDCEPTALFERLRVVDFPAPALLGLHRGSDVCVSRKLLGDRGELLATIIHEFAHDYAMDGEKGHVAAIERMWTRLTMKITGGTT